MTRRVPTFKQFTASGYRKETKIANKASSGSPSRLPAGTIIAYAGSSAPEGWLLCDGSEKAVATYPSLDSAIGTNFGTRTNGYGGAGSSHFKLPDLRGRAPVGTGTGVGASSTGTGIPPLAFTNPSFATNTTGWTAGTESNPSTGSTITRDTSVFDSSPASGRWDNTGASNNVDFADVVTGTLTGTYTAGTSYTVTWKMRANSPTNAWLYSYFGDLSSGSNYGSNLFINGFSAGTWASFSVSWTPTSTVTGPSFRLNDRSGFFGGASYYWIDTFAVSLSPLTARTIGATGGAETHTLSGAESGFQTHGGSASGLPHTVSESNHGTSSNHHPLSSSSHTHDHRYSFYFSDNTGTTVNQHGGGNDLWYSQGPLSTPTWTVGTSTVGLKDSNNVANQTNSVSAASASSSHSNTQPSLVVNYIIKT